MESFRLVKEAQIERAVLVGSIVIWLSSYHLCVKKSVSFQKRRFAIDCRASLLLLQRLVDMKSSSKVPAEAHDTGILEISAPNVPTPAQKFPSVPEHPISLPSHDNTQLQKASLRIFTKSGI